MRHRKWSALVVGVVTIGMVSVGAHAASAAPDDPSGSKSSTIKAQGRVTSTVRSVDLARAAASPPPVVAHTRSRGTLGINGKPTGSSLPKKATTGSKQMPAGRTGTQQVTPLTAPTTINANFPSGITAANCNCQPSDTNAAVSPTQIAHTVNVRLQVYTKTGTTVCGIGINALIGTTDDLTDPRIQWDNLNNRYSLVITRIPATAGTTPILYLLASQTADACGTWFVYTLNFTGTYPNGTFLDYPWLGQDRTSLLLSSNNFTFTDAYLNSTAFSLPKTAVYSGVSPSGVVFPVDFSTAPVTVTGIPISATSATYFLRSIPGTGYQYYKMLNSGTLSATLTPGPIINSPFSAPSREINQPGTGATLDPLDGRIPWSPYQNQGLLWFTHGQDLSGFPSVRYGAINTATNAIATATAYRSATSDDFNPSLGVSDAGSGLIFLWLNWAYTDTPAGVATSVTVDGVKPGGGIPPLIGTGVVLVNGASTTEFRFGDYSSVAIDPTADSPSCPAGRTAVIAQQYFLPDTLWTTRLGRLSFC
ncbi:MAG TPA: hypothetical protein VGP31_19465 [Planosporangium sp.]|nr:hypothetical protein [Planosporangium sp.]